jgi:hypothetical protein
LIDCSLPTDQKGLLSRSLRRFVASIKSRKISLQVEDTQRAQDDV